MWPFRRRERRAPETSTVLSFLTPTEASALGGLPPEAVVGVFDRGSTAPEHFRANRVFIDFMHEVIAAAGPRDPFLLSAAGHQAEGWIYLIDLRTPDGPQGHVPPEDILGAFQVRSGEIVADSYQRVPEHRVFTTNGMVQLPPFLRESLVTELKRRSGAAA